MRNPDWTRDELILALDLYFQLDYSEITATNPKVIELSEILNKLPIHDVTTHQQDFRNPNGVSMKLNNFKRFDPNYPGKGLQRGNILESIVWTEFTNKVSDLRIIANNIKSIVRDNETHQKLFGSEDVLELDSDFEVREGSTVYKLHKSKERKPNIVKRKKEQALKQFGKLECEVCLIDFEVKYGELGKGYIECHHKVPLAELTNITKTYLKDLALVCSNCHRMLHRKGRNLTIEQLKRIISEKKK